MRFLRSAQPAALLVTFLAIAVLAQQSSPPPPPTPEHEEAAAKAQMSELKTIVKKQFGPKLEIADTPSDLTSVRYLHPDKKKQEEWKFLFTGDLDGDGVEDAVIIVRFKNPLTGQTEFNYKVVDPYFTYHGYGNPKVTTEFQSVDPRYNHMILVIHGAGKEGWRAETPKMKFVIINLPFDKLSLAAIMVKKKKVMAIMAEESDGGSSSAYWDGKKYKWSEGASGP